MKKYIAEAVGTFALTLTVGLSLVGKFSIATPVLAALVIVLFVYSLGSISGGHFNPALTVGAWSIKKIGSKDAVFYIIYQCVGAAFALFLVSRVAGIPVLVVSNNWMTILAEGLGTALFAFGVASIIYAKIPNGLSGIVAGGSLLLGISVAVLLGSNGVLNPAVALGIGSFNLVYVFAPIVGSVLGMQAYRYCAA